MIKSNKFRILVFNKDRLIEQNFPKLLPESILQEIEFLFYQDFDGHDASEIPPVQGVITELSLHSGQLDGLVAAQYYHELGLPVCVLENDQMPQEEFAMLGELRSAGVKIIPKDCWQSAVCDVLHLMVVAESIQVFGGFRAIAHS